MSELIEEYRNQENFGTRFPIYFVIRDYEYVPAYHFCDAEYYTAVYDTEIIARERDLSTLFKSMKEGDGSPDFPKDDGIFDSENPSDYECRELERINEILLGIFGEDVRPLDKNMFLFKDEAEIHLHNNAHHYSEKAHVYCKHAWRTGKTERLLLGTNDQPTNGKTGASR